MLGSGAPPQPEAVSDEGEADAEGADEGGGRSSRGGFAAGGKKSKKKKKK